MDNNDFRKSQSFIIEDDNSLLMFEEEAIILVRKFKESIAGDVLGFLNKHTSFGRLKKDENSPMFGQIDQLNWVYYPSEGRDCKLLILGEKEWRIGKVKIYGECNCSPVLEKLNINNYGNNEFRSLLGELKAQGINDFSETRQINTILEFIPEIIEPQEPESPLDDIRKMIRENQT